MTELRIATRGSKLALAQSEQVRAWLLQHEPSLTISLLVLKTQGDRVLDRALSEIGGKGLFTKELDDALLEGRAELAVHSMKDVPTGLPSGLCIAAVPAREDVRDALIIRKGLVPSDWKPAGDPAAPTGGVLLASLPVGAKVGTSSLRRACQLRRLRADLDIHALRGNVDTRLRKLDAGELDAIVLAAAGLRRLGLADRITAWFSPSELVPASGQGALCIQCREADVETRARLARLTDAATERAVVAERAFTERLSGNCKTPLGAYAQAVAGELSVVGMVGSLDGTQILSESVRGSFDDAEALGRKLGEALLARGGDQLLNAQSTGD